jgi:hypothetical protein
MSPRPQSPPETDWLPKKPKNEPLPSGPELLEAAEGFIRRYVILPSAVYLPAALWIIASHTPEQFDCFPYLALVSPAKRSGKTRMQEVLEPLVRRPWRGTAPSSAALYRMLATAPTLMLDEIELLNGKNKSETSLILLAVLNAGHRKGSTIPRCEPPRHEVHHFPVYAPKVFCAIGRLPDTLMDRSIVVHMRRRTKAQPVERFRQARAAAEARPIHDGAARFVQLHQAAIEQAYQQVLDADLDYLSDRDSELWTPLFAICSVIHPERLSELKRSALILSAIKAGDDVDDSLALTLLQDIRTIWPAGEDKLETAILLERLKALEASPWSEPQHPLTARRLARMLKPFDVEPRKLRIGERTPNGYLYDHLKAAFDPYLDDLPGTCGTSQ